MGFDIGFIIGNGFPAFGAGVLLAAFLHLCAVLQKAAEGEKVVLPLNVSIGNAGAIDHWFSLFQAAAVSDAFIQE